MDCKTVLMPKLPNNERLEYVCEGDGRRGKLQLDCTTSNETATIHCAATLSAWIFIGGTFEAKTVWNDSGPTEYTEKLSLGIVSKTEITMISLKEIGSLDPLSAIYHVRNLDFHQQSENHEFTLAHGKKRKKLILEATKYETSNKYTEVKIFDPESKSNRLQMLLWVENSKRQIAGFELKHKIFGSAKFWQKPI